MEWLYRTEYRGAWDSFDNIAQVLGKKSLPMLTIENMTNKKLIEVKTIAGVKAMKITTKGKRVFESRSLLTIAPIKQIDITAKFYRNRFNNPSKYIRVRTAKPGTKSQFLNNIGNRADSISKGSRVIMGFTNFKKWEVQSILIMLDKKPDKNQELAIRIYYDIEKWLGDNNG